MRVNKSKHNFSSALIVDGPNVGLPASGEAEVRWLSILDRILFLHVPVLFVCAFSSPEIQHFSLPHKHYVFLIGISLNVCF